MKIGGIKIDTKLALAPMAGVTDLAFRTVCRELGAGFTYTEMISSKALVYQDKKTVGLLRLGENEHPSAVQIFGSDPKCMAEAAVKAASLSGADFLDINMGCPMGKVVKNGDGSALMQNEQLASQIVESCAEVSPVPVIVKIRKGWDNGSINAVEFAQAMERSGAAAICVHGRTRAQMFSGKADWDIIAKVKENVGIPVIANGDVFSPEDAVRILKYTKADMVMIGRMSFGNPWIFRRAKAALEGKEIPELPPLAERCDTAVRQIELMAKYKGEHIAVLEARKHYAWYLKGVSHASYYRAKISKAASMDELYEITKGIKRDLE